MTPITDAARATAAKAASTDGAALYRLMTWLSPAYPIGAYTYSHGLEAAVEAGWITDAAGAQIWLQDLVEHGGGFADAVLFTVSHDAARNKDQAALIEAAELASALAPTSEFSLETTAQGDAFMKITCAAWPCAATDMLRASYDGPIALPVAVAVVSAGHGIAKTAALTCYLQALAANLVSAAVRVIPLGQTDGQRITAALEPIIHATAARAADETLSSFGTATLLSDIASMHHETQYTRLFRS